MMQNLGNRRAVQKCAQKKDRTSLREYKVPTEIQVHSHIVKWRATESELSKIS